MQEFSSVTASSYDAESLAPLLNERARDGWEVVSIVSAGTNIVAYLSREAEESSSTDTGEAPVTETAAEETAVEEATAPADDSSPQWGATAAAAAAVPAAEPAAETPTETPTEEPAGWAAAPESTESTDESVESLAAQVGGDDPAADAATTPFLGSTEPAAEPEPAAETPAAGEPEPAAEAAPAAEPAPTAEPAVPAGWYADPSGRFELRYWDGSAWTEHVSRAGQQFTDPPVA